MKMGTPAFRATMIRQPVTRFDRQNCDGLRFRTSPSQRAASPQ